MGSCVGCAAGPEDSEVGGSVVFSLFERASCAFALGSLEAGSSMSSSWANGSCDLVLPPAADCVRADKAIALVQERVLLHRDKADDLEKDFKVRGNILESKSNQSVIYLTK